MTTDTPPPKLSADDAVERFAQSIGPQAHKDLLVAKQAAKQGSPMAMAALSPLLSSLITDDRVKLIPNFREEVEAVKKDAVIATIDGHLALIPSLMQQADAASAAGDEKKGAFFRETAAVAWQAARNYFAENKTLFSESEQRDMWKILNEAQNV